MYGQIIKPFIDRVFAICFLIFASPIIAVVLIGLYGTNKGHVFFFQRRPGKNEKIFKIVKFKTMTDERDGNDELLADEKRLTRFGKFVRATSLDELPQLFNVLKGDMSLVGPRPLMPQYLPLYNLEQKKRHLVKPGITGWAQVNGRNAISWEKKLAYDVWYVAHQSFVLDFKILLKTIQKVLFREDINTEGVATTIPFKGNE